MQKAVFIGVDGVQLEQLSALAVLGEVDVSGLEFISSHVGGDAGAVTEQATSSGPGWSTLLTGVWADEHGITSNNNMPINGEVESIFERVDAGIEDATIASIVHWSPINTGHFSDETGLDGSDSLVDIEAHGLSDADVTAAAVDTIANDAPDFTFVHLDDVDHAGHAFGFGEEYDEAMLTAFNEVNEILDAVAEREEAHPDEDWLVVVATDHGRDPATGEGHGGQSDSERQTFIAANQDLQNLDESVGATSVVPTILDFLGIDFDITEFQSGSVLEGAGDPIRPTVEAFLSPEDDGAFVAVDADLSVAFSEAIAIGSGAIVVHDAATGEVAQSVDVTSEFVAISGGTLTVDLPEDLLGGHNYYVAIDEGAVTDLAGNPFNGLAKSGAWNFTTDDAYALAEIFSEDWESLADQLKPFESPTESGGDGADWTDVAPNGWTIENNTPDGGPAEFFGWTFLDLESWVDTAGDQRRSEFEGGSGVVAVVDPDEYDDGDQSISPDLFDAALVSPDIDLTAAAGDVVRIAFASSWLPEDSQEARLLVSFDGGERQEILHYSSDVEDANYKEATPDERIMLDVEVPEGASAMQLVFDMPQAGNDWWWAVDDIVVSKVDREPPEERVTLLMEDFEGLADDLGPFVSPSESGGDGTDWTDAMPDGWTQDNATPTDGPAEFFGWTFFDKDAWIETAEDQGRGDFVNASGVVAVADGDEYDDIGDIDPDQFNSVLNTAEIDLSNVEAGSLELAFDSSWRPEDAQEARVTISYDGGEAVEVLHYSSDADDADFKDDATNEDVLIALDNPDGASSAVVHFEMKGGNDWWWALDNIEVTAIANGTAGGNADPVGVDDAYATDEGVALVVDAAAGVLANDDDADGDALAAAVATGPQHGVLALQADGSFTYTPDADFAGSDVFTYAVSDGNGGSTTASAVITVDEVADGMTLTGSSGRDKLVGGDGDDLILGLGGRDRLVGEAGDDTIKGGSGKDHVRGGDGDDHILGGRGADRLLGNKGGDAIEGGAGDDLIRGGQGDDVIDGGTGVDHVRGGAGDDLIFGGDGADRLIGANGDDAVEGGAGDDFVRGARGEDLLFGGDGADRLVGNRGEDVLEGGADADVLIGGADADTFQFRGDFGRDVISDWESGIDTLLFSDAAREDLSFGFAQDGITVEVTGDVTHGEIFLAGATTFDMSDFAFA